MLLIYGDERALDDAVREECSRESTRLVTDGPFAETREQLGGYFLADAKDVDEAVAIAAWMPMASRGTVEVRPLIGIAGLLDGREGR
jgi:hypothetical protein